MPVRAFAVGNSIGSFNAIAGTPVVVNLSTPAAGSAQNSYVLPSDLVLVNVADGTNKVVTLPDPNKYGGTPGDKFVVVNAATGQTLSVYPPTGGNISGAGANTAVSISTNKSDEFYLVSYTATASVWTSLVGA